MLKLGIGKTLIDVLNEKNENANSLANKVGVAPSTIYSIINRDNMKVDISLLAKICKALNVPMERFYIEYLQETAIAKNSTAPTESSGDDVGKRKLVSNYDLLNNEGQQDLVEYSDMLAGNPRKLKESDKAVPLDS